jgi:hypothetical protein
MIGIWNRGPRRVGRSASHFLEIRAPCSRLAAEDEAQRERIAEQAVMFVVIKDGFPSSQGRS